MIQSKREDTSRSSLLRLQVTQPNEIITTTGSSQQPPALKRQDSRRRLCFTSGIYHSDGIHITRSGLSFQMACYLPILALTHTLVLQDPSTHTCNISELPLRKLTLQDGPPKTNLLSVMKSYLCMPSSARNLGFLTCSFDLSHESLRVPTLSLSTSGRLDFWLGGSLIFPSTKPPPTTIRLH
jgi:hypothetical protein